MRWSTGDAEELFLLKAVSWSEPWPTTSQTFKDFPDKTLFQICSYLGPQRSERVLGHTEEPPPTLPGSYLILDFVANSSDIFNLALTS
jgi:hypothetical protein